MKIHSTLQLTHVNLRKEMAGDEPGRTAATLSFKGTLSEDAVKPFFSTEASYKKVLGQLWNKDNELATNDIKSIPLAVGIVGGKASIEGFGDKQEFDETNVDDVVLTPQPGRQVDVALKMSVHPDAESLWFLAEVNRRTVTLTCVPSQMSLPLDAEKAGGEGDRDPQLPLDGESDGPGIETEGAESPFTGLEVE